MYYNVNYTLHANKPLAHKGDTRDVRNVVLSTLLSAISGVASLTKRNHTLWQPSLHNTSCMRLIKFSGRLQYISGRTRGIRRCSKPRRTPRTVSSNGFPSPGRQISTSSTVAAPRRKHARVTRAKQPSPKAKPWIRTPARGGGSFRVEKLDLKGLMHF